jgi:HlyD family secretion protein
VTVVLDFVDPAAAPAALGDAYRFEGRIVIWEAPAVMVPTGALFREGEKWAVYTVENGRAHRVIVELGHQTGHEAEVLSGVSNGVRLILHPGDTLKDGARIRERQSLVLKSLVSP